MHVSSVSQKRTFWEAPRIDPHRHMAPPSKAKKGAAGGGGKPSKAKSGAASSGSGQSAGSGGSSSGAPPPQYAHGPSASQSAAELKLLIDSMRREMHAAADPSREDYEAALELKRRIAPLEKQFAEALAAEVESKSKAAAQQGAVEVALVAPPPSAAPDPPRAAAPTTPARGSPPAPTPAAGT